MDHYVNLLHIKYLLFSLMKYLISIFYKREGVDGEGEGKRGEKGWRGMRKNLTNLLLRIWFKIKEY